MIQLVNYLPVFELSGVIFGYHLSGKTMLVEVLHLVIATSVIIALWAMDHREVSTKILIFVYIFSSFLLVHYYKKLFRLKIKEVIDREGQLQDELIKNHQMVVNELKETNWEKLNAKQSELVLLQKQVERFKADNDRLDKTISKINSQYYHLVDKLEEVNKS